MQTINEIPRLRTKGLECLFYGDMAANAGKRGFTLIMQTP